jgi:hypothetical protein
LQNKQMGRQQMQEYRELLNGQVNLQRSFDQNMRMQMELGGSPGSKSHTSNLQLVGVQRGENNRGTNLMAYHKQDMVNNFGNAAQKVRM